MGYSISNAAAKVVNNAGGIVVDASAVEGGYFVVDSTEITDRGEVGKIPDYACIEGALCYCKTDSKFYQYLNNEWVEKKFSATFDDSVTSIDDAVISDIINGEYVETEVSSQYAIAKDTILSIINGN